MINNKIKFTAFSMVELMVVVTIIGILTSIAIPYYGSYRIKAKVTDGLGVLDNLKQISVDFYNQNAALPDSVGALNVNALAYTSTNISSVNVTANGVIQVLFSAASGVPCLTCSGASGATTSATLNLVPTAPTLGASTGTTSIISWQCGSLSIPPSYLPSGCVFGVGAN